MMKPFSPPSAAARVMSAAPLAGCLTAIQLLPLGALAAPPVVGGPDVLVQNQEAVIRNLVQRNVLTGSQPMVILAAEIAEGESSVEVVDDLCLEVFHAMLEGDGGEFPQTVNVLVRNLDGESEGQITLLQGDAASDGACSTQGLPPEADAGGPYSAELAPSGTTATILLDGSGSSDDNADGIASWEWQIYDDQEQLVASAEGETAQVDLPLGNYNAVLRVTDRDGELLGPNNEPVDVAKSTSASTTITIGSMAVPNEVPVADAGPDQTLTDEDADGFEQVQVDASGSTDDIAIVSYEWFENDDLLATGAQPEALSLAVGTHTISLRVTDESGLFDEDTVVIAVGEAPAGRELSNMTDLDSGQRSLGGLIDDLCPRLAERAADGSIERTAGEQQLLAACSGLKSQGTTDDQARGGLRAMTGEEIVSEQTNALDYSNVQLSNVSSRIVALRRGTGGGISIAGLNLRHDGTTLPLAHLGAFVDQLLNGGAASGDAEEERGGLLDNRLGIFINGNLTTGDKDETANEAGFDFDSWGITAGVDYRFTDRFVLGGALGYNESETEFDADGGGVDGDGKSLSVYGTYFSDNLYFDFIGSTGSVDYDSSRRILYSDVTGTHDLTASGRTDGDMTSLGVSFGYDFHSGGWTFGPTFALNAIEVDIDPFAETGAGGLSLAFGDQTAKSQTAQGGLRFSYTMSRRWGVLTPHARLSFVTEMENDSEAVIVNFVHDPFANDPNQPSPGITIITDDPDEDYARWGVGLSAVFVNGVSAFIDYESYAGLRNITSNELSFGVRFERGFR